MSVLIKDMEKPKSCFEIIDGDFEYCPFVNTDDDCVLLLKKGICNVTWGEQYGKCPLVEVTEPCEDAVSRAELLSAFPVDDEPTVTKSSLRMTIKHLPSVTPKRKTGKWIEYDSDDDKYDVIKCPCCKHTFTVDAYHWTDIGFVKDDFKFCPNCSADMRGE